MYVKAVESMENMHLIPVWKKGSRFMKCIIFFADVSKCSLFPFLGRGEHQQSSIGKDDATWDESPCIHDRGVRETGPKWDLSAFQVMAHHQAAMTAFWAKPSCYMTVQDTFYMNEASYMIHLTAIETTQWSSKPSSASSQGKLCSGAAHHIRKKIKRVKFWGLQNLFSVGGKRWLCGLAASCGNS